MALNVHCPGRNNHSWQWDHSGAGTKCKISECPFAGLDCWEHVIIARCTNCRAVRHRVTCRPYCTNLLSTHIPAKVSRKWKFVEVSFSALKDLLQEKMERRAQREESLAASLEEQTEAIDEEVSRKHSTHRESKRKRLKAENATLKKQNEQLLRELENFRKEREHREKYTITNIFTTEQDVEKFLDSCHRPLTPPAVGVVPETPSTEEYVPSSMPGTAQSSPANLALINQKQAELQQDVQRIKEKMDIFKARIDILGTMAFPTKKHHN